MLLTFVEEPAFSKHVQQFHRALTKHYSQGDKHLYDPAEVEAFCDQHAPGLFGQLYKSIVNDNKRKPSKKRLEIQKTRVVSMLHNLSFFCNLVQVTYICALFVPMENSKAVVTFSCFNLFSTDKRSTAEEDCYAKRAVKTFFCMSVCARKTVPSRRQMV